MHEASIAASILNIVIDHCHREDFSAIESVRVRIGKGSNTLPEALSFAFDVAKRETIAAGAELVIEQVGITAKCLECGEQAELEDIYSIECPACSSYSLRIMTGYEMEIVDMDISED